MWRKGDSYALLVGEVTGAAAMENRVEAPQKLKVELPYDPATLVLGVFLKKIKALTVKDMCTLVLTLALFIIANMWTQPKCSLIDEWINKIWYKYTMDYYSALKTEILSYATTRRGLEGIMLN